MKNKETISETVEKKSSLQRMIITGIGFILILIAFSLAVYFYNQYRQTQKLLKNPTEAAKSEIKTVIDEVGKLMELPKGEEPTLATVSDKTKLQNQLFFKNAENGDKVLIYTNAKKVILYRPSINKIIEASSINVSLPTPSVNPSENPTPTQTNAIKVALYNGTKTSGLASSTEKQITGKYSNMSIVLKSNAKSDYTKTLIVDLTGTNKEATQQLVDLLGGEIGPLPQGETKPNADLLVILGK